MTWNYRLLKSLVETDRGSYYAYKIHEVYYNEKDEPTAYTENPIELSLCYPGEEDKEATKMLIEDLEMILEDLKRLPVLEKPKEWK